MKCFLITLLLIVITDNVISSFCYWNTGCPYKYFSSKTPYNSIRGDIRDSTIKLKGCEPISIWGLYRHGKRNPGIEFSTRMEDGIKLREYVESSYRIGNSSLCAQDVDNLMKWIPDDKMFKELGGITEEGHLEMVGLGQRFKQAFSKLLSELGSGNYTLRPANNPLMVECAKSFIEGLNVPLVLEEPKPDFDIMNPYEKCDKYIETVRRNNNTFAEGEKYLGTSDYLAAKDRIERRTGFNFTLTDDNITAIYDLCRYTWDGIANKPSPWCALFTTDDLIVLEYIRDMDHYYRNSYGSPINEKFGRIPLADLLKSFEAAKLGGGKIFTAYFSHATTLDMVFTALELFKDEKPLTAAHRDPERKWRSSQTSALAANFVAVLNSCPKDGAVEYNVVFYRNEEPLRSICRDGVCSWREFTDKLTPFLNTTIDICNIKNQDGVVI